MSLPINDLSWVKLLAPQLWMLSWQEMSHYICKKKYDIEKKRPTQLSLDDNLTRDYIRIWPFDFEYSMAFIMYINKYATICVYLLGIIQIVIGKIQKVRCVKLKGFFSSRAFKSTSFSLSSLVLILETILRWELHKKKKWYFVTKIVLTYCEKKLF